MSTTSHRITVNGVVCYMSFDERTDASRFVVAVDVPRQVLAQGLIDGQIIHTPVAIYNDPNAPLEPLLEQALLAAWSVMADRLTRLGVVRAP